MTLTLEQYDILECLEAAGKKLSFNDLRKKLEIKGEERLASFNNALQQLREKGKIYFNDGFYQLFTKELNLYQGKIKILDKGKGVTTINHHKFFIPQEKLNGALDDDIVVLKPFCHNENRTGAEVIQIVKRANNVFLCELNEDRELVPLKRKYNLLLNFKDDGTLVPGDRVTVELGEPINGLYNVSIKHLIGHANDPDIELSSIAHEFGFYNTITPSIEKQLKTIPTKVEDKDCDGRTDLTNEMIYTIDGIDTKDIDDAISITINERGNYVLKVHIADVSHYIKPGSPLYNSAMEKGTSLYLIDKVLPMFPHQISNGICSLNEGVPRLTKTCEMEIDKSGEIINFDIYKSIICSNKKMNYDDVNLIVDSGKNVDGYEKYVESLLVFKEFSLLCNQIRQNRGALSFDSDEYNIAMNNETPLGFSLKRKGIAEVMIENAMLSANETVAAMMYYMDIPFIYRNHKEPEPEQIEKGLKRLKNLKIMHKYSEMLNPKELNKMLIKAKKDQNFQFISPLILRHLNKADYGVINSRHHGLRLQYYTHFTSPIRRFPDLTVHRLLDRYIFDFNFENLDELEKEIIEIASHSSYQERQADSAEMAADKMEMAKYLEQHFDELKGKDIEATISWIDDKCAIVKLSNGIVGNLEYDRFSISSKLSYERETCSLTEKNHGKSLKYNIGDKVMVNLTSARAKDRYILFTLKGKAKSDIEPINILEPYIQQKTKRLRR